MANTLVFVDLPSSDPQAAATFYRELFGWTINPRPEGVFYQIVPGEGLHLGLFGEADQVPDPAPKSPQPRPGPQARTYIPVDASPAQYPHNPLTPPPTAPSPQPPHANRNRTPP